MFPIVLNVDCVIAQQRSSVNVLRTSRLATKRYSSCKIHCLMRCYCTIIDTFNDVVSYENVYFNENVCVTGM